MARHARRSDSDAGRSARVASAEARRLAEREQVSGEIRMPADLAARRARRVSPPKQRRPSGERTAVSARSLVPERTLSGRLIVMTLVALVVVSFLVPTVRTYLQQRSELAELEAGIAEEQQRQDALESEISRWDDPEYVRQQARERINLAMPGERQYHVIGDLTGEDDTPENQEDSEVRTDLPWAEALWDSLVRSAVD
ncbi:MULTISPECIES: septum formation initiator family protein [Actinomycetes]|uniref:Septum formation initiator family protein n=2 Tax=Actinomycetes TaxID=1760 RepID=A0ABP6LXC7_9MICC